MISLICLCIFFGVLEAIFEFTGRIVWWGFKAFVKICLAFAVLAFICSIF